MRQIQHFFLPYSLQSDHLRSDDRALILQLMSVLRFKPGDSVVLLDGNGVRAEAVVEMLHRKEVVFKILNRTVFAKPERQLRLAVACAKKPATLEWIFEKATELGVHEIVLLDTARTQVHELRKMERALSIIKEAAEQSERVFLPTLIGPQKWADFLKDWPEGTTLVGDPWDFDVKLGSWLQKTAASELNSLTVVIGPEGGLTPEELAAARAKGATLFQLGETVLRMETAVLASLSLVAFGR